MLEDCESFDFEHHLPGALEGWDAAYLEEEEDAREHRELMGELEVDDLEFSSAEESIYSD